MADLPNIPTSIEKVYFFPLIRVISLYECITCCFVIVCYLGLPKLLIILATLLGTFLCVNVQKNFSRIRSFHGHTSNLTRELDTVFQNSQPSFSPLRVPRFPRACIFTNSSCPQSLGDSQISHAHFQLQGTE